MPALSSETTTAYIQASLASLKALVEGAAQFATQPVPREALPFHAIVMRGYVTEIVRAVNRLEDWVNATPDGPR